MTYNQQRHIELLQRSKELEKQGKDLYLENQEECLELYRYNAAAAKHFFWQDRYQFASLLENFVNKKIDGQQLCDRVYGIRRELNNKCERFELELISVKIKSFQPDERSKKLNGLLTAAFCCCDEFMEDYENDEFSTAIQNGFLKLQDVLNEE